MLRRVNNKKKVKTILDVKIDQLLKKYKDDHDAKTLETELLHLFALLEITDHSFKSRAGLTDPISRNFIFQRRVPFDDGFFYCYSKRA